MKQPIRSHEELEVFQIAFSADAEAEAAETQVWLRFSSDCRYLDEEHRKKLQTTYDQVIGKLVTMINNPEPWTVIRRA